MLPIQCNESLGAHYGVFSLCIPCSQSVQLCRRVNDGSSPLGFRGTKGCLVDVYGVSAVTCTPMIVVYITKSLRRYSCHCRHEANMSRHSCFSNIMLLTKWAGKRFNLRNIYNPIKPAIYSHMHYNENSSCGLYFFNCSYHEENNKYV